jgi:transposase-like protein
MFSVSLPRISRHIKVLYAAVYVMNRRRLVEIMRLRSAAWRGNFKNRVEILKHA